MNGISLFQTNKQTRENKLKRIQIGVTDTMKIAASNEKIKRCTHGTKVLKHFFHNNLKAISGLSFIDHNQTIYFSRFAFHLVEQINDRM